MQNPNQNPIWLILDKSGITRHQVQAATEEEAIKLACRRLKRAIAEGLPKGWRAEIFQPPEQAPRPIATETAEDYPPGQCGIYTEGDTVRRTGVEESGIRAGVRGTITQADPNGVWVEWFLGVGEISNAPIYRETRYFRNGVGADGLSAIELVKSVRPEIKLANAEASAQAPEPRRDEPRRDEPSHKLLDIRNIITTAKIYPRLDLIDAIETILNREP